MYKKITAYLLLLLSVLLIFVGCTAKAEDYIFGTFFSTEISGKSASKIQNTIVADWTRLENTYSTQVQSSTIAKINGSAANIPISVDAEILNLFRIIASLQSKSMAFNPAIFPLVNLWGFAPNNYVGTATKIPTAEEISALLPICQMSNFIVDYTNATVTKKIAEAKLDFGAFLKGYAVDVVSAIAKDTEYVVNIGGTIKTNKEITVAIKSPRGNGYGGKVTINNQAIATSGDYERYYVIDGVRYCHIIGSQGYPSRAEIVDPIISVTIVGESGLICDALSTLVFILGLEGKAIVESYGYSAYILTETTYYTIGEQHFEPLGIWKK